MTKPTVAPIESLDYITLSVSNVETSGAFYSDTFGLEVLNHSRHFALLALPNVNLGLHGGENDGTTAFNLHFRVADLDEAYDQLQARGVAFSEEPRL